MKVSSLINSLSHMINMRKCEIKHMKLKKFNYTQFFYHLISSLIRHL